MDIFFTSNEHFKHYLYTALYSILCNAAATDSLSFHILDGGISNETKNDIDKLKKIKDFSIDYTPMSDDEFLNYPLNPVLTSRAYYYRLKIPSLFPQLDRILYLDADIIVTDSLSELYNIDMNGKIAAFGANGNIENEIQNSRLYLSKDHIFFNSGVMLLDCKKWTDEHIEEKIQQIGRNEIYKSRWKWLDQDLLNIVFDNNYKLLKPKFNFWPGMNSFGYESEFKNYKKWFAHTPLTNKDIKEAISNPTIIHFCGGAKPDSIATPKTIKLYNKIQKQLNKLGIKATLVPQKHDYRIFNKIKQGNKRIFYILGLKFSYMKRRNKNDQ